MKKEVPVKTQLLLLIRESVRPLAYKVSAIMEDHYTERKSLNPTEFVSILELQASAETLVYMLDEFLQEAEEEKVEMLYLSSMEYKIILELSKVAESSSRYNFSGISLRTH